MEVKEGDKIRPAVIETGVTDGSIVQIISGLKEGDEVITAMKKGKVATEKKEEESQNNPFVQQRMGPGPGRR